MLDVKRVIWVGEVSIREENFFPLNQQQQQKVTGCFLKKGEITSFI